MSIVRLDNAGHRTKGEALYRMLRQRIVNLQLPPGSLVRKDVLAEEFGVSRAPLNDALARLREEGLVVIAPQHGTFVAKIRLSDIREGMFARRTLEPAAARLVAASITEEFVEALDKNIREQKNAIARKDPTRLYALDEEFHSLILGQQGFEHTAKFLHSFSAHLMRARNLSFDQVLRLKDTVAEHERITIAIKSGDPEWAASEMDAHLAAAYAALSNVLKQRTQHFADYEDMLGKAEPTKSVEG